MWAGGHHAEDQLGRAFEDLPEPLRLVVELGALSAAELVQCLNCDIEPAACAAQVPDSRHCPADEQHRKVACLATGKCALRCRSRKDQRARMASYHIRIEV